MRGRKGALAVMLCLLWGASAGAARAADLQQLELEANAARARADYDTAIDRLRQLTAASPSTVRYPLMLAETLAWAKRFPEAERLYRTSVEHGGGRDAELGLARVLLWTGRYREAGERFDALIRRNAQDVDALEGAGTAAYWSGDLRSAEERFAAVVALEPREFSRKSLGEIRSASRPVDRLRINASDDDQPYRSLRTELETSFSTNALTRWGAAIGTYAIEAEERGREVAPFAFLTNETGLPRLRSRVSLHAGLMRFPDGKNSVTGGASLFHRLGRSHEVSLAFSRRELLATATSIGSHPTVDAASISWRFDSNGLLAAAEASRQRYFDGNRGWAAWAYVLRPIVTRAGLRLSAGVSADARDTDETRFAISAISTEQRPAGYTYHYRSEYTPYWTPQQMREARAVISAQVTLRAAAVQLHATGGVARDRAVAFGPAAGTTLFPTFSFSTDFRRVYHPYSVEARASLPIRNGLTFEIGATRQSTAFYQANALYASVVRHR